MLDIGSLSGPLLKTVRLDLSGEICWEGTTYLFVGEGAGDEGEGERLEEYTILLWMAGGEDEGPFPAGVEESPFPAGVEEGLFVGVENDVLVGSKIG